MKNPPRSPLPTARIKKHNWSAPFIWLVPVLAALVAVYLVYARAREFGPTITIQFEDVEGLKPGQTTVRYRGADIGEVAAVKLNRDQQRASVKVKIRRSASSVAREGASFWIVRPQVGMGNITGLSTIITGPYIAVQPGTGKNITEFIGTEHSPLIIDPHGLKIVLHTSHAGSLNPGVPVYYRGIEVGSVQEKRLSTNAATVEILCVIRQRYAALVRSGTKFWNASGVDFRFGLFRGAEVNMESLKSLIVGGIAFATPDDTNAPAVKDHVAFRLYDQPEKAWLEWEPSIAITPLSAEDEKRATLLDANLPQDTPP